jgi:16S rRNA (adenine1518-N6/adenine1519-N6)-dimethyltransferase
MTPARRLPGKRRDWIRLIDELGLRPSKGRGQNFLLEPEVIHAIAKAAEVSKDDWVVEIGPGLGILTQELLARAGAVTAIEIDPMLATHIRGTFADVPQFALVEGDALAVDYDELVRGKPFRIVANLPYSAGAAIVQRFLETSSTLTSATIMLQKEVGERILAEPPAMSILAVAVQVAASGYEDFVVLPESFWPSPAVDSMVLTLVPHGEPLVAKADRARFFALVNAGFRHKRKNIANSLHDETKLPKAEITRVLTSASIDSDRRAQTLSVSEWIDLFAAWDHAALSI